MSVLDQPVVFFACLGVGAASCLWYAFLWLIRTWFPHKAVTAFCDVFFVAASACAYFLCLLRTTEGEFRIYTLFAYLIGFAGFYAFLKPLSKKIAPKFLCVKQKLSANLRSRLCRLRQRKKQAA